ncbi:glycosyltransferase [Bradyrhizobium sp. CCBAU 51627]|uniref:glycosyltransferase n=1 Tax=Bradyrhizobium sp. CCBAU 51627 TaxID=1325088 RepID=UPI002305C654|nr:glycosyltransferase [Bradyrhizobium sp. CCBAU 51627]MDA9430543.1 hypothetical protein [Bradyrhizobium sp. CCBAU 51627]
MDRVASERDYGLLICLLDALRPFLNPDQSSEARLFWEALIADSRAISQRRIHKGELRSVWGVTPIVNLTAGVAADRALGLNSCSIVFTTYHTSSRFDFVFAELQNRLVAERGEDWILFRWLVLIWALVNFDVFHLYNDRGIIEPAGGYGSPRFGIAMREMEIYRSAGKRLYTYAYGADHRTRNNTLALGRWSFCSDCPDVGAFCVCDDAGAANMLKVIREHSTAVIAHGLAMKLIPGAINIPYLTVDMNRLPTRKPSDRGADTLIVGHFPNHGYFKGTKYLEQAIDALKAEGFSINLLYLSGKPHEEILRAMCEVDVLVDQLVSGAFGLTAVEAMAMGCPVICYLHDDVAIANRRACPIIEANPETIKDVLKGVVTDRAQLSAAASAGPGYVKQNYSIDALSRHLADLYVGSADLPNRMEARIAARTQLRDPAQPAPGNR